MELEIESVELEQDVILDDGMRALMLTLKNKKRLDHQKLIAKISKIEGIVHLEEL